MSKEEKLAWLQAQTPEKLLKAFIFQTNHFNPIDEDTCEWYDLTKEEILRRLHKAEETK